MTASRSRPLLAVRLVGPSATVTTQLANLRVSLAEAFGREVICRTSAHPASHGGEIRAYLTFTRKGPT
jgi:hypothetical protein